MRQFQQGDILMYQTDRVPDGARKIKPIDGKFVIARGEATGHQHVIEAKPGIELYEKDGVLYLFSPMKVPFTHEEHHSIGIETGITVFENVREKDHFSEVIRRISD